MIVDNFDMMLSIVFVFNYIFDVGWVEMQWLLFGIWVEVYFCGDDVIFIGVLLVIVDVGLFCLVDIGLIGVNDMEMVGW